MIRFNGSILRNQPTRGITTMISSVLIRVSQTCFVAALLLAVVTAGDRGAAAAGGTCDNTCVNGKTTDKNPCITSATGTCVPAAGAAKDTICIGCQFAAVTGGTGKVLGCTSTCTASTTK
jgi:hypothetical protein